MGVSEITMYTIAGVQESTHTYGHHTKCGGGHTGWDREARQGPKAEVHPLLMPLSKDSSVLAANRKELVITTTKTENLGI